MARRHKRRKLPESPVPVKIESFCHDGRGVAHVDGKVTFVDGGLPGEEVTFRYTSMRRDYAEGCVDQVIEASPLRTEPECEYYGRCGGCSFQHVESDSQINVKQQLLQAQFSHIAHLSNISFWPALNGPQWGYRRKARLGVKYVAKKGRVLVGFREKRNPYVADMLHCKVLHPAVGHLLGDMSDLIDALSIKNRVPQVEVAIGDNARALVFRVLDTTTAEDNERLLNFGQRFGFAIYLQPQGPDSIVPLDSDTIELLDYQLPEHGISCSFHPLQFTQVNAEINRKMVSRAVELLDLSLDSRVLDLFCGLGNFTLPIARYADSVVGVEGSQALVDRARNNALINNLDNVQFYVADLDKDLDAENWCKGGFSHALLDPSRAGAKNILKYLPDWGVKRIVYVSCNPSTLARDAGVLVNELGYTICGAGVMDMFPQTAHVESIALFEKQS